MRGVRVQICLVVSVLAVAGAGCGSDDETDGDGGAVAQREQADATAGQGADTARDGGAGASSDEERIEQVLKGAQKDFVAMDGEAYCARLVPAEQRDVVAFGRNIGYGKTCAETIAKASKATQEQGVEEDLSSPKSYDVRIDGRRASVKVTDRGGATTKPVKFVRVEDEWKIAESGFEADPLAEYAKPSPTP